MESLTTRDSLQICKNSFTLVNILADLFNLAYLGIPLYLFLYFGSKVVNKTKIVNQADADLFPGKDRIDGEEREF